MAGNTLGALVNDALLAVKEPEITSLQSGNILQLRIIDELNDSVDELANTYEFDWALQRFVTTLTAEVTTGTATFTNGSATVSSNAENFGSITANMWIRKTGDNVSYGVASISTGASPDTLVMDDAYVGTTATAAGYRCFQDEYAFSTANFDQVRFIEYGDAGHGVTSAIGFTPNKRILPSTWEAVLEESGGDFHRDTSGRPKVILPMGVDSSDNPVFKFWPFPRYNHQITVWFQPVFSDLSAFSDKVFAGDAPSIAYTYASHRCKQAACFFDKQYQEAAYWEERAQKAIALLLRREHDDGKDMSWGVNPYRVQRSRGFRARSGIHFDTKSSFTK
tara:strand:- start:2333 stop:3337 length:1005 start_codon:yes stop_codon:yes gene_type:complete